VFKKYVSSLPVIVLTRAGSLPPLPSFLCHPRASGDLPGFLFYFRRPCVSLPPCKRGQRPFIDPRVREGDGGGDPCFHEGDERGIFRTLSGPCKGKEVDYNVEYFSSDFKKIPLAFWEIFFNMFLRIYERAFYGVKAL